MGQVLRTALVAFLILLVFGSGLIIGAGVAGYAGHDRGFETGFYQGVWASCMNMTKSNRGVCLPYTFEAVDKEIDRKYRDHDPIQDLDVRPTKPIQKLDKRGTQQGA